MKATTPEEMLLEEGRTFDIAVSMETFEHVPPDLVSPYLKKIAMHLDGYLFITVPNEKGIVLMMKWLVKRLFSKDSDRYTLPEFVNAVRGKPHLVKRNEHKGFDYDVLVKKVKEHFDLIHVGGHPLGFLPTQFCFGVGILAKSKGPKAPQ